MDYVQRSVRTNGITLRYLDWGGDGPVALFMHPTGFHSHVWEPYAEHLAGGFRCLAFDTRGHGDSDKPGIYGWTDFADDLEGVIDALGLSGVTGIGHSAGATSIAIVAARRPGAFSRAVLIDPILFFGPGAMPQQPDSPMQQAARRRRMVFPSREAMIENYSSKPPLNGMQPRLLELYVRHGVTDEPDGTVRLKCSGDDEAEMYAWGPRPLVSADFLPHIQCPVLIVGGGKSVAFPPERAKQAAAMIPNARLVTIAGATHFVPFERPEAVEAAIDEFLGEAGVSDAPVTLRFVRLREGATAPRRASDHATGYDVSACLEKGGVLEIGPDPVRVPTGLAVEAPPGCDVQLRPRSGLSASGVIGAFGTLDPDYRGEVFITLYTVGSRGPHLVYDGDRIAQLVVARAVEVEWQEAGSLSETTRGSGGHGSTGR